MPKYVLGESSARKVRALLAGKSAADAAPPAALALRSTPTSRRPSLFNGPRLSLLRNHPRALATARMANGSFTFPHPAF